MNERAITRAIEILETNPDFFVPLKKLWLMLQGESLALDVELDDFHHALLEDARFEFTPGVDHREGLKDNTELAEEMEQEMEALNFYGGPRVKLVSRKMMPEDVFSAMAHSLEKMNDALQGAWKTRPENDQEIENRLLNILAAGQKLEREIQGLIKS
ncbi:MAG: hypothetical protein U9R15_12380 [Chloroflexota bacterium]|nr:hypothetical protein [Chloroflexota bacterium]